VWIKSTKAQWNPLFAHGSALLNQEQRQDTINWMVLGELPNTSQLPGGTSRSTLPFPTIESIHETWHGEAMKEPPTMVGRKLASSNGVGKMMVKRSSQELS
jgi:hypothetical protein